MMADELKVQLKSTLTNGGLSETFGTSTFLSFDQNVQGSHGTTAIVGTGEEIMTSGDITTPGWLFMKNLDTGNYVEYGPDSSGMVTFGKLKPSEVACMRIHPNVVVKWKADTADCRVQMLFLDD